MKPTATLALPQNAQTMPLPDDFASFEGRITILSTKGLIWFEIPLVNEGQLRARYTEWPNQTGRPQLAALQPLKGTTATAGTRWQMFVFPTTDQAYTIQFQYYVLSNFLDGAFPFPMGGMAHAETILESCLAVAEQRQDDAMGVHTQNFQARLSASIAADRRNKAATLGYNYDRSDNRLSLRSGWWHAQQSITYRGTQYALLLGVLALAGGYC